MTRTTDVDDGFVKLDMNEVKKEPTLSWPATLKEVINASIPTVLSNIFLFLI